MAKVSGAAARSVGDPARRGREGGDSADTDWSNVLAEVPLFTGLSARHIRGIAKLAKVQRLGAYTKIVREGEPGDSFFLLLEGTAMARPPGKRAVKLSAGDFFGELALLDSSPRSATVEAQGDVLVARIGRRDFLRLLEKEPKVSLSLLHTLATRLRTSQTSSTH